MEDGGMEDGGMEEETKETKETKETEETGDKGGMEYWHRKLVGRRHGRNMGTVF
ncbi:hypothetical protein L0U88_04690 [Flavihumibacter sp. RY-1]|uniref:Uncharacterized protein n=1 Tax=Flavihumibacter fluminis TaxID=2909236 RepID=A0ABS9BEA9_9BACT|nr:hypothetical protein [Flavihumibacter fluminis]MCF1713927.1 hypothetical protein [Flavihumibacter fluminis]